MRQNTRRLRQRALNSLILAIELFNRPQDQGRVEGTLILLQHAFEMILKAKIWEERQAISERGSRTSHTFDKCLGIARSDFGIIDEDEARTLSIIDGLRDCAAHNLLEISEDNLYLHVQAGVTIFSLVLDRAFHEHLADYLPNRVLPISTSPPQDIDVFLDNEIQEIRELLRPRRRQQAAARARLRPLLIMEANTQGNPQQPTTAEVTRAARRLKGGENWRAVFPGVATLRLDTAGHGLTFSVKFTRNPSAAPVRYLGPDEDANESTLIREVNLLDRYSLGLVDLASRMGLTAPRTRALVLHLELKTDEECYKEFKLGAGRYGRYSPKALERLRAALSDVDMDQVWEHHRPRRRSSPPG